MTPHPCSRSANAGQRTVHAGQRTLHAGSRTAHAGQRTLHADRLDPDAVQRATTDQQRKAILKADLVATIAEADVRALMNRVGQRPDGGYALAKEVEKKYKGVPRAFFSRKAFLEDALHAYEIGVPLLEKLDPDPETPSESYDAAFERHADEVARKIERLIPPIGIRVFISHSADDGPIAKKLIELIEAGLEMSHESIRCTSVESYKLHAGADAPDTLRGNLQECSVVVGLLTKASLASPYVLMELGAAWAFKKTAMLLLHDVSFEELPGPFKDVHGLRLNHRPDLAELVDTIARNGWLKRTDSDAKYLAAIDALARIG